jgi:hypothetical protein
MKLKAAILTVDGQKITESAPDKMFELMDRKTGATEELSYDEFLLIPPMIWDGKAISLKFSLCATDSKGEKHFHPTYRDFPLTLRDNIYPERWADWRYRPPTLDEIMQLLQDTNLLSAEAGRKWNIPVETKLTNNAGALVSDYASNRMRGIIDRGEQQ